MWGYLSMVTVTSNMSMQVCECLIAWLNILQLKAREGMLHVADALQGVHQQVFTLSKCIDSVATTATLCAVPTTRRQWIWYIKVASIRWAVDF